MRRVESEDDKEHSTRTELLRAWGRQLTEARPEIREKIAAILAGVRVDH